MSASGASFTFLGQDFADYGVYVIGREWPRLPQPRVNRAAYAQRDGGVTQGSTFERRSITLECGLVGSNAADRETKSDAMVAALAQSQTVGPGDLLIDYPVASRVWKNARLMSSIESTLGHAGELFTLEFEADPWSVAAAESSDSDGFTDGVPIGITPEGTLTVPVEWIVKASGDGAGVTIANAQTGETAIYSNAVSSGEWLKLNALTRQWSISVDSGANWTSVSVNTSGVAPYLQGGVSNAITISGVSGTLDYSYTAGYMT